MTITDGHVLDRTDMLADELGLDARVFAGIFGTGWRLAERDPAHAGLDPTPWHVSGDPAQLMLRAYPHGVFLARPEGVWVHGTMGLEYRERDQIYVARHGLDDHARLDEVIVNLVRRRRSTFRYCRYCRRLQGPELMFATNTCHGCASLWEGVTY